MLTRKHRLKKKKDFERVFKEGKGFRQDLLFLKVIGNELGEDRFGFIVSKKIAKSAVVRNRIKRRLREIVRQKIFPTPGVGKGKDVVLVALAGIEEKSYQEMEEMVGKLFRKAKIF